MRSPSQHQQRARCRAFSLSAISLDCVRQKNADAEQSKKHHCEISHRILSAVPALVVPIE
jgi:hypothetical protein